MYGQQIRISILVKTSKFVYKKNVIRTQKLTFKAGLRQGGGVPCPVEILCL